ncbi:ferritin [Membranicola marinus]|uniref:Ferritin n=1 Tax=Membranihabitans marinus TaxID=1227546 RepID=A0A953HLE4_9BACT|nr:ferritin [Membranihabitans marinus]MBY5957229.1 ferritin [Membranihabitans marinus]
MSPEMQNKLNNQIGMEAYASFLYLSMSVWCDYKGLMGCARFLKRQSAEEHMHMMKLVEYVQEVDGYPSIPSIAQPPGDFKDIDTLFQEVLGHEKKVTRAINDLVEFSSKEKDHSTYNFLQWYVEEQREEENLMRTILDKINLIGDSPQKLYYIDKELEAINDSVESGGA